MTPGQWTRFKYQLELGVANAKANNRDAIRIDKKHLGEATRQYRHAFDFDSKGRVWFNGVRLESA